MKKLMLSCCVASMVFAITGCSAVMVGEQKEMKKDKSSATVIINNYYLITSESNPFDADHRKQRGRTRPSRRNVHDRFEIRKTE